MSFFGTIVEVIRHIGKKRKKKKRREKLRVCGGHIQNNIKWWPIGKKVCQNQPKRSLNMAIRLSLLKARKTLSQHLCSFSQDVIEVRPAHVFNTSALHEYLKKALGPVEWLEQAPIIRQFSFGQSNPTFLLEYKSKQIVLRKKPPGKLLRGAHAIERLVNYQHSF